MPKEFYSNGKLLLSGEYAVLDGAKAWAIPTKFGQYLRISQQESKQLIWKSIDEKGAIWFEGVYHKDTLGEISATDNDTSLALIKILMAAQKLNPDFLEDGDATGYEIESELTFPRDWGLGSSSTLVNNIAQWAGVDAYALLALTFGGSGYDIACAQHNKPISYQLENGLPTIEEIKGGPPFADTLYFVYLNKKRNSRDAINAYRKREIDKSALVGEISQITIKMMACDKFELFELLMSSHESVLSEALGIPGVKEALFSDYRGTLKSLGAWGGDFILATGDAYSPDYFKNKGYHTVISFQEMIL